MVQAILSIVGSFVPFVVRLLGDWLDKNNANAEVRAQYVSLVRAMQKQGLLPARLRDDYERQLEELNRGPRP